MERWKEAIVEVIEEVTNRQMDINKLSGEAKSIESIREYTERIDGMQFVLNSINRKLRKYKLI